MLCCLALMTQMMACVKHGVPQGSMLSPLQFILCVNDLPWCSRRLYVDDITLPSSTDYHNILKLLECLQTSFPSVEGRPRF